jgi:Holliday junction resolvasome RuvABC ATP-dependent DNA helicase subunit
LLTLAFRREQTAYPAGQTRSDASHPSHSFSTINHCPPVTPLFKGRRRILERLSAYFCARDGGMHRRREFLLYGMGGSGKSQIALKFAEECEERWVFSVDHLEKSIYRY